MKLAAILAASLLTLSCTNTKHLQQELARTQHKLHTQQEHNQVLRQELRRAHNQPLSQEAQHILTEWHRLTQVYNNRLERGHTITDVLDEKRNYSTDHISNDIQDRFIHRYARLDPVSRTNYLTQDLLEAWQELETANQPQPITMQTLRQEANNRGLKLIDETTTDSQEAEMYILRQNLLFAQEQKSKYQRLYQQDQELIDELLREVDMYQQAPPIQQQELKEVPVEQEIPQNTLLMRVNDKNLLFTTTQYVCEYAKNNQFVCMQLSDIQDLYRTNQ